MEAYGETLTVFKRQERSPIVDRGNWSSDVFEYLAGNRWIFQEKIDGTNMRIIVDDQGVCDIRGRTDKTLLHPVLIKNMASMLPAPEFFVENQLTGLTIYGEGYGPGIQEGGKYRTEPGFIAFDVWRDGVWWGHRGVQSVCDTLGIQVVPIVARGALALGVEMVSEGLISTFGGFYAEGLIARTEVPVYNAHGGLVKCKIKHRDLFIQKEAEAA